MAEKTSEWRWMTEKFTRQITPENDALLSAWIDQSEAHRNIYEEALKIWRNSTAKSFHDNPATEQEWLKFKARVEQTENSRIKPMWPTYWIGIAASVLFVSVVGIFLYYHKENDQSIKLVTITSGDNVETLFLPDSSRVWLNINSQLAYPADFGQKNRIVELTGEAYFVVHPDSIPFSINIPNATIQVLGTSFNVSEADSIAVVIVAQGQVSLMNKRSGTKAELAAGEMGIVRGDSLSEKKNTDSHFSSWRRKNNPAYDHETEHMLTYIMNKNTWKKNQLNLSVVEGTLTNNATLAAYKNIVLKVTYTKQGRPAMMRITITDTLLPGQKLTYRKNLLDIFSKTEKVSVEVEKAETNNPL